MRGRWLLRSLNLLAVLALLGLLFIMVNWVASKRYARWDLTRAKVTRLSDQTLQALKATQEPVAVTVFYQPEHRLYDLVRDLLEEYRRASPRLRVEFVDPDQDVARAKLLAQQLQIDDLNVVIFQSGEHHKELSDTELADYDYGALEQGGAPRVKAFKGEEAFTSAILSVTQATRSLIWFTTGHGEKSLEDEEPAGVSELKRSLERQNLEVKPTNLLESMTVAPEVKLIVIAGPTHRFVDNELSLLETYLIAGGRLLVLLDPLTETGLEPLLERWGIRVGRDIVVDPAQQLPFVSAANLFVTTYTQHPIVEKMKTLMTLFPLACSVSPVEQRPEGIAVVPLAMTSEQGWGEHKTEDAKFEFNEGEDRKGPVSIAVAAERSPLASRASPPGEAQHHQLPHSPAADQADVTGSPAATPAGGVGGRLVVFGDSDFVINSQLNNVGNRDILLGASFWLIEQERLIGISPKALDLIKLNLTTRQLTSMFWLSLLALPLLCGMLGTTTWWVRRT